MVSKTVSYVRLCSCGCKLTRVVCGNVIDWRHSPKETTCKGLVNR